MKNANINPQKLIVGSQQLLWGFQEGKRKSQEKRREKKKKADDHNHLKMICYELLTKVCPLRKGKSHNWPIIIKGKNTILYFVVRDYMGSKKNKVWVDVDSMEAYIWSSGSKKKIQEDEVVDGRVLLSTQQS